MAGFEESDLYAAFGLEQPAGGNEPGAAEPGAQEGQARGTEPGTGEAQAVSYTHLSPAVRVDGCVPTWRERRWGILCRAAGA